LRFHGKSVPLPHEKKKQVFAARGKNDDPFKVIAMLGGTCLKKMQELAEVARDSKLGGTLILCPYYFRPESVKELVAFCKKVADVASGLLCYYYHIPYG